MVRSSPERRPMLFAGLDGELKEVRGRSHQRHCSTNFLFPDRLGRFRSGRELVEWPRVISFSLHVLVEAAWRSLCARPFFFSLPRHSPGRCFPALSCPAWERTEPEPLSAR
jgi:hypothetical protein